MNNLEFSQAFDTLINSYSYPFTIGREHNDIAFNEYEKSLFLTQAQSELIVGLYNGTLKGEGYETTEEMRRYLDSLIVDETIRNIDSSSSVISGIQERKIDKNTYLSNLLFIVYEEAVIRQKGTCVDGLHVPVVPVLQDEFNRVLQNPFRSPSSRRVLRYETKDNIVLITKYDLGSYRIRYIKRPAPIILGDLEGVEIDGKTTNSECEVNPILHNLILNLAVQKALQSKNITTKKG